MNKKEPIAKSINPSQSGVALGEALTLLVMPFQPLGTRMPYPQNSFTDTVHAAQNEGFYDLRVELENNTLPI